MGNNLKVLIGCLIVISVVASCQNQQPQKVENSQEYKDLLKENNHLQVENDSLKKALMPFVKKQQKEKANSKGLIYNDKISIVQIESGFNPYNSDRLWLPCVTIKFKNISSQDINDFVEITVIFINNSKGEQIGTDDQYLTTSEKIFVSGANKQLSFTSSIGWYAVSDQNVTAKIYVEHKLVQTLKVKNKEFDGMIR